MNRLRSSSLARLFELRFRTYAASMVTCFSGRSGASNDKFLDDPLQDRVEAPGPDVLGGPVDLVGEVGHGVDGVGGELDCIKPFGGQEGMILDDQRGPRARRIRAKSSRVRSCSSTRMGNRP